MNKAINLAAVVVMAAGLTVVAPLASTSAGVLGHEQVSGASTLTASSAHTFRKPRPCRRWTWCAV